ncbi:MAG: cytochrome-c peroxidase, partial [Bacteroidota bacterium]|nr:cytochrome-c peroxidase [Bacteroidota bacterium]
MKQVYFSFILIIFFAFACSSPEEKKEEPIPVPTPYQLQFSDRFQPPSIPEDNPLTEEGVALGRR